MAALLTSLWALSAAASAPVPSKRCGNRWRERDGALEALLTAIILAVPTNVDVLAAQRLFAGEAAGWYAAAAILGKGIGILAMGIGGVLLPQAVQTATGKALKRASIVLLGLVGPVVLVCLLVPREIVVLLFGSGYGAGAPLVQLYAPAMGLFALVTLLTITALAQGRRGVLSMLAVLSLLETLGFWALPFPSPEALGRALLGAHVGLLGIGGFLYALPILSRLTRERASQGMRFKPDRGAEEGGAGAIAIVAPFPPPGCRHVASGGVASYTRNLVEALRGQAPGSAPRARARDRPPVLVVAPREDGDARSQPEDGVLRVWRRGSPRFVLDVWRAIRRLKPTVVHVQHEVFLFGEGLCVGLVPLLLGLLRLSVPGSSIVVTLHGVPPLRAITPQFLKENGFSSPVPIWMVRAGLLGLFRALVGVAHRVVVHEELFRQRLVREYRCPRAKIEVIPHGIERVRGTVPTVEAAKRALGLEGRRVVLFLGFLTGYKGVGLLVEAFTRAAPRHPDWTLLLAGGPHPRRRDDPAYQREFQRLDAQLRALEGQARLLGFVSEEELPWVFRAADVVVFPYTTVMASSGPLALCVAYGRPFLASEAFRGMLPDPLLFPLDPEALRVTLETFFSSGIQAEVAQRLIQRWQTERSWSRVAEQTWALYRALER